MGSAGRAQGTPGIGASVGAPNQLERQPMPVRRLDLMEKFHSCHRINPGTINNSSSDNLSTLVWHLECFSCAFSADF